MTIKRILVPALLLPYPDPHGVRRGGHAGPGSRPAHSQHAGRDGPNTEGRGNRPSDSCHSPRSSQP